MWAPKFKVQNIFVLYKYLKKLYNLEKLQHYEHKNEKKTSNMFTV